MNKEDLIARQKELKDLFDKSVVERNSLIEKLKDLEAGINQFSGAYQEVTRQISEIEKKEETPNEN